MSNNRRKEQKWTDLAEMKKILENITCENQN
jgi:hypothetical protein